MTVVIGRESKFLDAIYKCGLVPDYTRRILIDIRMDEPVKIYYETLADRHKLDSIVMTEEIIAEIKQGKE